MKKYWKMFDYYQNYYKNNNERSFFPSTSKQAEHWEKHHEEK